ncbi:MAG TPA: hypothetical protein VGX37_04905 [Allosphingosinicella sp.]|nr:hypothetical protein [Allosphingosinicella sp.]
MMFHQSGMRCSGGGEGGTGRIWPHWARTLGAMIDAGAAARFACPRCRRVYDVDLEALASVKGRAWSLIDRRGRCKASTCRALGWFTAAQASDRPFLWLAAKQQMPRWLAGTTPADHSPPPEPPPHPPAPPGVDPVRWAWADERERKRMVRAARG